VRSDNEELIFSYLPPDVVHLLTDLKKDLHRFKKGKKKNFFLAVLAWKKNELGTYPVAFNFFYRSILFFLFIKFIVQPGLEACYLNLAEFARGGKR